MRKVKDIIKNLQELDPESRIMIAYWTKEHINENYNLDLTDTKWSEMVEAYEENEWFELGELIDAVVYTVVFQCEICGENSATDDGKWCDSCRQEYKESDTR
jgi:hypothetical protein